MSLKTNPQSFSPQNDASIRPIEGALLQTPFPPDTYIPEGHPFTSNDNQDLPFTHPIRIPWNPLQADPIWMLNGQGSTLLMQDRPLNPDIGMAPLYTPSSSNPRTIHGNHHTAGVPLGMNTVEDR